MSNQKWDLQSYLEDMRQEQREAHKTLTDKLDELGKTVAGHETRITVLDNMRRNVRWLATVTIGALIMGGLDLLLGHWRK